MKYKCFTAIALVTLLAGCDSLSNSRLSGSRSSGSGSSEANLQQAATSPSKPSVPKSTQATKGPVNKGPHKTEPLKVSDRVWLGDRTLVRAPTDPLPSDLQLPKAVNVSITEPQVLAVVLGRIEAEIKSARAINLQNSYIKDLRFDLEERAPRSNGKTIKLAKPPSLNVNWHGPLSGLLDGISGKTGYRWHYSAAKFIVTFYRYHDQEFADNQPKPQTKWIADPAKHTSLRKVLQSWTKKSGWALSWSDEVPDYSIGAKASFKGSFVEAVTALAETNRTVAPIVPWFYSENKQLVIRPAKEESL